MKQSSAKVMIGVRLPKRLADAAKAAAKQDARTVSSWVCLLITKALGAK